jgi:hypothetical protein
MAKVEGLIIVPVGAVALLVPEYKKVLLVLTIKTPRPGKSKV